MPLEESYSWGLKDVKGGSLSYIILFGIPYEVKHGFIVKAAFLAEVLLVNSTTGYLLRWSIITNTYWLFASEPKKSRLVESNVSEGVGWDSSLCRLCDGVTEL